MQIDYAAENCGCKERGGKLIGKYSHMKSYQYAIITLLGEGEDGVRIMSKK